MSALAEVMCTHVNTVPGGTGMVDLAPSILESFMTPPLATIETTRISQRGPGFDRGLEDRAFCRPRIRQDG